MLTFRSVKICVNVHEVGKCSYLKGDKMAILKSIPSDLPDTLLSDYPSLEVLLSENGLLKQPT
jgi:hypothetical protein